MKCIDYIEKWSFMAIFLFNLYIFVWIQHGYLSIIVFVLDPSRSVTKRLCIGIGRMLVKISFKLLSLKLKSEHLPFNSFIVHWPQHKSLQTVWIVMRKKSWYCLLLHALLYCLLSSALDKSILIDGRVGYCYLGVNLCSESVTQVICYFSVLRHVAKASRQDMWHVAVKQEKVMSGYETVCV